MIKIYNDTYDYTFWVSFGNPQAFVIDYHTKFPDTQSDLSWTVNADGCIASDNGGKELCIWLRRKTDIGAMGHECYHAVTYCLAQRSDINANDHGGEEAVAYMQGWLLEQVWKARRA